MSHETPVPAALGWPAGVVACELFGHFELDCWPSLAVYLGGEHRAAVLAATTDGGAGRVRVYDPDRGQGREIIGHVRVFLFGSGTPPAVLPKAEGVEAVTLVREGGRESDSVGIPVSGCAEDTGKLLKECLSEPGSCIFLAHRPNGTFTVSDSGNSWDGASIVEVLKAAAAHRAGERS